MLGRRLLHNGLSLRGLLHHRGLFRLLRRWMQLLLEVRGDVLLRTGLDGDLLRTGREIVLRSCSGHNARRRGSPAPHIPAGTRVSFAAPTIGLPIIFYSSDATIVLLSSGTVLREELHHVLRTGREIVLRSCSGHNARRRGGPAPQIPASAGIRVIFAAPAIGLPIIFYSTHGTILLSSGTGTVLRGELVHVMRIALLLDIFRNYSAKILLPLLYSRMLRGNRRGGGRMGRTEHVARGGPLRPLRGSRRVGGRRERRLVAAGVGARARLVAAADRLSQLLRVLLCCNKVKLCPWKVVP